MQTLRELQIGFAAQVYDDEACGIEQLIRTNPLPGSRRLRVYRNNITSSLIDALRAVYPIVQRLVGEEFFEYLARQYLHAHPSRSGHLGEFGEHMPSFAGASPELETLPYLHDVASLEWSYHLVFHAAHHAPLDLARLGAIPSERYEELKFHLHPACRLLESRYPILRIWQVNQIEYSGDAQVDLAANGDQLLIIRRELDVEIESISSGAYALLAALREGDDFIAANGKAIVAEPELDVVAAFQYLVSRQVLVDFAL